MVETHQRSLMERCEDLLLISQTLGVGGGPYPPLDPPLIIIALQ